MMNAFFTLVCIILVILALAAVGDFIHHLVKLRASKKEESGKNKEPDEFSDVKDGKWYVLNCCEDCTNPNPKDAPCCRSCGSLKKCLAVPARYIENQWEVRSESFDDVKEKERVSLAKHVDEQIKDREFMKMLEKSRQEREQFEKRNGQIRIQYYDVDSSRIVDRWIRKKPEDIMP